MFSKPINILLADDDKADCLLFKDALAELPISAHLTIVHDGKEVMEQLTKKGNKLLNILFLDLNMPQKNGFAALAEIKSSSKLQNLPVIIFSTAAGLEAIKMVFKNAAHYYICKPADFIQLKKVIYEALTLISQKNNPLPLEENFMISGNSVVIPDKN